MKFVLKELPSLSSANSTKSGTHGSQPQSTNNVDKLNEQKEKLFFMLLGLSLETLSSTTGLGQLTDETIENILESLDYILQTSFARSILLEKSIYLCVEILSILYK